jgi:hypothetical protein
MAFRTRWTQRALAQYDKIRSDAQGAFAGRKKPGRHKTSKQEGLFGQVTKALRLLAENPRHPGLRTHPYWSLTNPYDAKEKVFEAYAQSETPGAYRVFWCYGPATGEITILAITPHP